jgi:hypothetical protein
MRPIVVPLKTDKKKTNTAGDRHPPLRAKTHQSWKSDSEMLK